MAIKNIAIGQEIPYNFGLSAYKFMLTGQDYDLSIASY